MEETKVVIEWEKLKKWDDIFDLKDENKESGLYQITGHHPVFGDDSLLYIGMAKDETFSERFKQSGRREWMEQEQQYGITVYVGRVDSINNNSDYEDDLWEIVIADAEALLIFFHSPPYNAKSISKSPKFNKKLRIINTGDCGDLYPELSHEGLELYDKHPRPSEE